MTSSAYRIRRRTPFAAIVSVIAISAILGAGSPRAQAGQPFADRLPNVVLKTHEGTNVRFYDDLLKDKIVLINFMYVTCQER